MLYIDCYNKAKYMRHHESLRETVTLKEELEGDNKEKK